MALARASIFLGSVAKDYPRFVVGGHRGSGTSAANLQWARRVGCRVFQVDVRLEKRCVLIGDGLG